METYSAKWNLEHVKIELSKRKEVKGWVLNEEHIHRRERYFLSDRGASANALAIDQDRDVSERRTSLRIFVQLPSEGRQGEATKILMPSQALSPQIDTLIQAAQQTNHQAWDLPEAIPSDVPQLKMADPKMAEDLEGVMRQLTSRVADSVGRKRKASFNSAELFLSVHDYEQYYSNGLTHRYSQSRIYAEAAFSAIRTGHGETFSNEHMNTRWAVSLDDIKIEQLFDEAAERAEFSLTDDKPESGRYSVIVDAETLEQICNALVGQLSASSSYHRLPFFKPGADLVEGATGDLLSLTLDPSLEFGASTAALYNGIVQKPLVLVDRNRVVGTSTDKQYADYLGIAPTTATGNLVVTPGTLSHAELSRHAPKVLEILQFSALSVDASTATFSSEIRLARLFDNEKGTVKYLRGGSLSGSVKENFRGLRLSNQLTKRAQFSSFGGGPIGYFGPAHALLSDVSVVG